MRAVASISITDISAVSSRLQRIERWLGKQLLERPALVNQALFLKAESFASNVVFTADVVWISETHLGATIPVEHGVDGLREFCGASLVDATRACSAESSEDIKCITPGAQTRPAALLSFLTA
jgi:hypothetical protein